VAAWKPLTIIFVAMLLLLKCLLRSFLINRRRRYRKTSSIFFLGLPSLHNFENQISMDVLQNFIFKTYWFDLFISHVPFPCVTHQIKHLPSAKGC
jgi:hypothetical protein